MDTDESDAAEPDPAKRKSQARTQALRALGRREQSSKELQGKLVAQGFDEACAEDVLQELAHVGWQSDQRYAELLVRSRIAQGYGPRRIAAELATRGVDESIIRIVLAAVECDWVELAEKVYRKRFTTSPASLSDRQKRYRFLAGRGFNSNQITRLIDGQFEE